jgi:hypothetical protein
VQESTGIQICETTHLLLDLILPVVICLLHQRQRLVLPHTNNHFVRGVRPECTKTETQAIIVPTASRSAGTATPAKSTISTT